MTRDNQDLRTSANDRNQALSDVEDGMESLGDEISETEDLVGDVEDANHSLRGTLGSVLDHSTETLRYIGSYLGVAERKQRDVNDNIRSVSEKMLDRRTFLTASAGAAVFGALIVDNENWMPTDGNYDPLPGQDHNSEQPHDDLDAIGTGLYGNGNEGFEPGQPEETDTGNGGVTAEEIKGELIEIEYSGDEFTEWANTSNVTRHEINEAVPENLGPALYPDIELYERNDFENLVADDSSQYDEETLDSRIENFLSQYDSNGGVLNYDTSIDEDDSTFIHQYQLDGNSHETRSAVSDNTAESFREVTEE